MLLDAQVGLVIEQLIQHVSRVTHGRVDHLDVEGRVLVREVRVEQHASIGPVTQVNLAGLFAAAPRERNSRPSSCEEAYRRMNERAKARLDWKIRSCVRSTGGLR